MAGQKRSRGGEQKQKRLQLQIQATMRLRAGAEELSTWREGGALPGVAPRNADLGYHEEADGDQLLDDGDEAESGEPGEADVLPIEEADEETGDCRRLTLTDLIGSRRPVVLLRLDCAGEEVTARTCALPRSWEERDALVLLGNLVKRCFRDGRPHFTGAEWKELLLGHESAPPARRLALLLRLAIRAGEKVALDFEEHAKATVQLHNIGLERLANKFAALPDGTPFSIRLLLLDQRGRSSEGFFDQLPDAVKLLALRKALRRERQRGVAVSDNEFRDEIQHALAELLATDVPKPTEDQVRRRLRDNFKRKGLGDLFPNQAARQSEYDRIKADTAGSPEESA